MFTVLTIFFIEDVFVFAALAICRPTLQIKKRPGETALWLCLQRNKMLKRTFYRNVVIYITVSVIMCVYLYVQIDKNTLPI